jgi:hypothetical protein
MITCAAGRECAIISLVTRRRIVDSFLLMDRFTTMRLHALPFRLLFGVERSADALDRFLADEPPFDAPPPRLASSRFEASLCTHGPARGVDCQERTPMPCDLA